MDYRAISAQGPALSQVNADALVVVLTPDLAHTGDAALDRLIDDAVKAQDFALKAGKTLPRRIVTEEGIFPMETAAAEFPKRKY